MLVQGKYSGEAGYFRVAMDEPNPLLQNPYGVSGAPLALQLLPPSPPPPPPLSRRSSTLAWAVRLGGCAVWSCGSMSLETSAWTVDQVNAPACLPCRCVQPCSMYYTTSFPPRGAVRFNSTREPPAPPPSPPAPKPPTSQVQVGSLHSSHCLRAALHPELHKDCGGQRCPFTGWCRHCAAAAHPLACCRCRYHCLQALLADPVMLTSPRTGPNACLRVGSVIENYRFTQASAKYAWFSLDCSTVPDADKVWQGTEQAPGWWQFSTIDGSGCLTIVNSDIIRVGTNCE